MAKGEIFKGLPKWAQGVIAVAVVGGIGYISFQIYKKVKAADANKASKDEIKSAEDEIKQLSSKIKPTMTQTQLNNAVNGIKNAFLNYDRFTRTHVQPFYRELAKVGNDLDMLNLIKAYKIQTIDFPALKFTANDFTGGLTESVKNFLTDSEIDAANGMLARKGIKNRF